MIDFVFGTYPYICAAVFLIGSLARFDRSQGSWKSESSQFLAPGLLRWGSNLFHVGVLALFFGHLFGLLTPSALYTALGLTVPAKQTLAIAAGGVFGALCLAGLLLLLYRRLSEPRLRATSTRMDLVLLGWLLVTLLLGLASIFVSLGHPDGAVMLQLGHWAQHIATFRPGAAEFIRGVHPIYRAHLAFGLTLFLLFPFSRLVHVWSGFGALGYLVRTWQIVRARG